MRFRTPSLSIALLFWILNWVVSSSCWANSIYNVGQTVGSGTVTGSITTDGTIGVLSSNNILDWNLVVNDGTNTVNLFGPLSGSNS
jgi:hypothetical protein